MALQDAQAKWERKTARAGEKWKARVQGKQADYCRGLARSLGVSEQACLANAGRAFAEGVAAVSSAEFQSSIAGKGAKWAEGTRRGIEGS